MSLLFWLLTPAAWADGARRATADQAYARLTPDLDANFDRAVVNLINQTLEPVLLAIHARVMALDPGALRRTAATIGFESSTHHVRPTVEPVARALGFDRAYVGFAQSSGTLTVAFTPYNRRVMLRLLRATATLDHYLQRWHDDLRADPELRGGAGVLRRHSAARDNLREMLNLSNDSILQAAAQLTASPVDDLGASELLGAIFARERGHPSLLNALALALPPGVLGPNGDFYYFKNPLARAGGKLRFSDPFRQFLKTGRARFRARWPQPWETGRGCPVAHALDPAAPTALDLYLSAVLRIYDAVEP